MSDPAEYTVGWICALLVEYIAAQEFLDDEHDKPSFVSPNDANDYTLGRIGEHKVVIAVLPDGEYGTASAANVAANMLNSFQNIRIGLMVGIGGGAPSESHDIRLGDVVVSAPRDGEGGVFQYDFGKSIQGQSFQRTRFLNQPPTTLRTAMTGIRAQYKRKGHQLQENTKHILDKNPRLRHEFERPPASTDKLFKAEVIHDLECHDTLCADDPLKLVLRPERADYEDNPAIHYGLIASGNQLMKDALIRDSLAAERDVLCFEMEGSGLINTFPCLVIRGICDYSDSHKNKKWQGYAALVAASYAKDLLQRIPLNRIEAETRISAVISEKLEGTNQRLDRIASQHDRYQNEQKERAMTDQQQCCHQAFKIANYTEQKDINPRRVEGTCLWALQSPEYIRWSESACHDLLWVSADPGCGKSVLARSIIDDYLEEPDQTMTVCYFFFKDNEEQNHLAAAMCSVLHQLFSQRPDLLRFAMPLWEKNGEKLRQEVEELWRIFVTVASDQASCKTICIFDALDECREADQGRLIAKLKSFHCQSSSSAQGACLKFLVTSRPYDHIQDHFRVMTTSFPHLHLKGEEDNDQIHKEIDIVVRIRVKDLAETARLSRDITQRLEKQLLQMEHRTYLWLHLAMDDIRSTFENSIRPAEESIRMIPSSVHEAYKRILSRVPSAQVDTVRKVLQIIVAARRPLTTVEMAMALGTVTSLESRTADEAGLDPSLIHKKLRRLCGLFVFVKNSKFYLIHKTARDFLIAKSNSDDAGLVYPWRLIDAEDQIARVCLRYLLMEDLVRLGGNISSNSQDFLHYCAVHWADHVRQMDLTSDQEVMDQLHRLYDPSGKPFSLWFPIFWDATRPYQRLPVMKALHLAGFNGHEQKVQFQLDVERNDINIPDDTGAHAIMWGSLNGYDKIVRLLLEHGADVNAQGGFHGNALQAACSGGHDKIMQLLLEHGADVKAQGVFHGNALQAACSGGHDMIVQLLLEHGADVNAQGGFHLNALQATCSGGHEKIVQLLLEYGANVNAQRGDYGNAIQVACSRGDNKIVQRLLKHGADVNVQSRDYGNALQAACSRGHDKIVQLLLDHGVDVNTQGGSDGNALQAASYRGHDKIVQLLLEHGADVNAQGGFHANALKAACYEGHDKVVQLLLEHGADVNTRRSIDDTTLQVACSGGHDKIVQLLLEHGADINAQGRLNGNALQAACYRGHNKIVQLLLKHGADVNAQPSFHGNAFQAACSRGHDKIVQLLLDHGANVNTQGGDYGNTLQAASHRGHDKIVQLLLEHGANINAQGGDYGNALQAACHGGHDNIVQLLLEHGADVNAQGDHYGNALQAACYRGNDKIVQLLLEHGAHVNTQGGRLGNAFQVACLRGHYNIVLMLQHHCAADRSTSYSSPFKRLRLS